MFTYALMGLPFIGLVILLDVVILKTYVIKTTECWMVMGVLLVLTAVFNQFLTGLPIVTYDQARTLDIHFGNMPIEDFLYAFAAVIGLGSLYRHYEK